MSSYLRPNDFSLLSLLNGRAGQGMLVLIFMCMQTSSIGYFRVSKSTINHVELADFSSSSQSWPITISLEGLTTI